MTSKSQNSISVHLCLSADICGQKNLNLTNLRSSHYSRPTAPDFHPTFPQTFDRPSPSQPLYLAR
ncbi:hypothetical protein QUB13_02335 [Microcoleus sp. B4-D4]